MKDSGVSVEIGAEKEEDAEFLGLGSAWVESWGGGFVGESILAETCGDGGGRVEGL